MLVAVKVVHVARRLVAPADAHVTGAENLAQLIADDVDDRLEFELGANRVLDAVDHRELGVSLPGLGRAFGDSTLERVDKAGSPEGDRGLSGEQGECVAIVVIEAAVAAIEIDVEKA